MAGGKPKIMTTRSRKEEKIYNKYQKSNRFSEDCVFCNFDSKEEQEIQNTRSFRIVRNLFPYSQWDGQGVLDHLMIVPKKHTDTLNDLDANEAIEYVGLIGSYESEGYSIYSRSKGSTRKSVIHQHTHLIKLDNQTKNVVLYMKKPYIRFVK